MRLDVSILMKSFAVSFLFALHLPYSHLPGILYPDPILLFPGSKCRLWPGWRKGWSCQCNISVELTFLLSRLSSRPPIFNHKCHFQR